MADGIWIVGLGVLGLIFGSFIATVAIRWPEGRSPFHGRSQCDHCDATLSVGELIPLGSFIVQRAKCRRCGARIDWTHPGCEAFGLIIGLAAGAVSPDVHGLAGAVFGWLLLLLGILDLRAFWLPDIVNAMLALAGIATGLAGLGVAIEDRLIGGLAGFAVLWSVAFAYKRWRGRDGLGGGDAKLFGAIGLWIGWHELPLELFTACMLGLIAALAILVGRGRLKAVDRLPLGTLLAISAFPIWLTQAIR